MKKINYAQMLEANQFTHVLLISISFFLLMPLHPVTNAAEIYKYKDENGKWVFTDKEPLNEEAETINVKSAAASVIAEPEVFAQRIGERNTLQVKNPFSAPIEVEIQSPVFGDQPHRQTIPAKSTDTLYAGNLAIPSFVFRWVMGDPDSQQDNYPYRFPIPKNGTYHITQGFNGRFSHTQQPSQYAVDIDLPVGSDIAAAREGTVILVKDNYNFGGKSEYFLDKANHVMVSHADGTYGVYAHILSGSASVKPGQRVSVGSKLARSGSSGFSSGPHLHFVVLKNVGFKTISVPFVFVDSKGGQVAPRRGLELKHN